MMDTDIKELVKMKIFPKGQIVIPVHLRKRYQIDIGDHIELISGPEGILLRPLGEKISKVLLTDQLFGVFNKYSLKKKAPLREDIENATEEGFLEGWKE